MKSTQVNSLERALLFLNAAGVEYAIRKPDGTVLGTLEIAAPVTKKKIVHVNDFAKTTGYVQTMEAMQPGEVAEWPMGTRDLAVGLQKVVSARANKLWESGNFITTTRSDNTVEVLRVI